MNDTPVTEKKRFATFWIEGLFFGIEVEQVQEVIRYQELTRAPLSPPGVKGLINLRGNIVTAVDLRQRLCLNERPAGETPMNVVIRNEDETFSLLVDAVGDVLEVDDEAYEPAPARILGETSALVRGVYKLDGRLMHLFDLGRVMHTNREN